MKAQTNKKRPACIHCVHYYVTYDPAKPHGCRAMGFKSAQNPAAMVFASSRIECQMFQLKKNPKKTVPQSGDSNGGLVA